MSKSEKWRYTKFKASPFPLENYTAQLIEIMVKQPESFDQQTLLPLIQRERSILFERIARFVPLETAVEITALLKAFIAEEKKGAVKISEEGELGVEIITNAFLERGKGLIDTGNYLLAAELALAIILAIESELCFVYDEGWTYQVILFECFDLLRKIGELQLSPHIFEKIILTTTELFNNRPEEDRNYDNKWMEVILTFKNASRNH